VTHVVLFRRRISSSSGAGPLMGMQADALAAHGSSVELAAARGGLGFFLRTGRRVRHLTVERARNLAAAPRDALFVDHGAAIPAADLAFVHNVHAEAEALLHRRGPEADSVSARVASEASYFRALATATPLVANSELAKRALIERYGLAPERVHVHYPGYRSARFAAGRRAVLRATARRSLGLAEATPLVGFVTSGDFDKRGLDVFLAAAGAIAARAPATRFLVVGARRLPEWAARDSLVGAGALSYRPKNHAPERWIAALDLFLYPARFEEFGIVVVEAQALGVPVLTSRRVGAAETLPAAYAPWLLETPDPEAFAAKALELLADSALRTELAAAALAGVERLGADRYADATAALILAAARGRSRAED
jgi:glycosyltransferase involved in cell wall biosynthesis